MPNLQMLRKRFKSIQATADMASAMKTASTVKYAKISRALSNIEAYSRACEDTLSLFGDAVLKMVVLAETLNGKRTFTLRLNAFGRSQFGEVFSFTIK